MGAGSHHAPELAERRQRPGQVLDDVLGEHQVERGVGEREPREVGNDRSVDVGVVRDLRIGVDADDVLDDRTVVVGVAQPSAGARIEDGHARPEVPPDRRIEDLVIVDVVAVIPSLQLRHRRQTTSHGSSATSGRARPPRW